MKTRYIVYPLVALAALGAIFGYKFLTIKRMMAARAAMVMPPVTVSATKAEAITWPNSLKAVGSLASYRGITVKSELEGAVKVIAVQSGAAVKEGDLLVQLDTSVETAQLVGLEAQVRLAELNLGRARDLRANGTNTPSELDTAETNLAQAHSTADQLRATIAKKRIVAPFAGRVGIVKVYPGQFLGKADAIVELETLDPIYADFTLPQQELSRVAPGKKVQVSVDAQPDHTFEGTVEAIGPRVNDGTRTLNLRAALPNADEVLRPGMFANVEVVLAGTENTVVLPTAAIVYNPYGNFIYVIEKGVANQRFVQTGAQRGNLVAVLSGVKAGEEVVTSGQIKLRNGSPIRVDNAVTPSANPTPSPKEG